MPAPDFTLTDDGWADAETRQPLRFDHDGTRFVLPVRRGLSSFFHEAAND